MVYRELYGTQHSLSNSIVSIITIEIFYNPAIPSSFIITGNRFSLLVGKKKCAISLNILITHFIYFILLPFKLIIF